MTLEMRPTWKRVMVNTGDRTISTDSQFIGPNIHDKNL